MMDSTPSMRLQRWEKKCKIQSSLKFRLVNRHIFLYKSNCTQNQVIQLANLHIYFLPHAQGQHIVFFFNVHMKICFLMFLKIARSHMILFIIFHMAIYDSAFKLGLEEFWSLHVKISNRSWFKSKPGIPVKVYIAQIFRKAGTKFFKMNVGIPREVLWGSGGLEAGLHQAMIYIIRDDSAISSLFLPPLQIPPSLSQTYIIPKSFDSLLYLSLCPQIKKN